ncbi:MAG: TonB-dependent receptor [Pseudomonadota bacterium]
MAGDGVQFDSLARGALAAAALLFATASGSAALAETPSSEPLSVYLDRLIEQGYPLVYSRAIVTADMRTAGPAEVGEPVFDALERRLTPHRLALRERRGRWLVVPAARGRRTAAAKTFETNAAVTLEEVVVTASRYRLPRDTAGVATLSDRVIDAMPDLGDDPLRSVHQLPGAAAGGTSARAHLRGGDRDETGIELNGHSLLDPFHVRDYQNLFSVIDARAVRALDVYTGGYPARYGNRLSGLIVVDPLPPHSDDVTEIGLSVYNTSLLLGRGDAGDTGFLVSARRGNLDLVLDEDFGEPDYRDAFVDLSLAGSAATLRLNGLLADDRVVVATENEPDEQERSSNTARNRQWWATLEWQPGPTLYARTIVSRSSLDIDRQGLNQQPDKIFGSVSDRRSVTVSGVRQSLELIPNDAFDVELGAGYFRHRGRFDYAAAADYFGAFRALAGGSGRVMRAYRGSVAGESLSGYVTGQWQASQTLSARFGLRFDKQTYTVAANDEQWSPRLGLLYRPSERSEWRLSIGRYYQPQQLHELQVEDGIADYRNAQRADHFIVGFQSQLTGRLRLRAELYRKNFDRLRPRFENLFDPVAIIPELEPDRVRIAPERGRASGVELSLHYRGEFTEAWGSYVVSRVTDTVAGRDIERAWDQRHAVALGAQRSLGAWTLSSTLNWHSGWPATSLALEVSAAGDPVLIPGRRNAARYGDFMRLDARLSRRFDIGRGELTVFVEVSNLTDRRNACCVDFDIEEDSQGHLVLERAEEHWLPVLPAAGVSWRF